MRNTRLITPLAALGALLLGACSSGPVYTGPAPIRPLQLTIVRPEYDRLLVQTNRYAYVAVFEILPERGVSIVYPATQRQAESTVGGREWLPVALTPTRPVYRGFPPRRIVRAHYVYALASDRPFQISDADYDPAYLRQELGEAAYRGDNVAATMRALEREFVPVQPSERWSEDSYALEEAQETPVVRVYCADGTSLEVRETIVARINCSTRAPVVGSTGGYHQPSGGSSGGTTTPRERPPIPWGRGDSIAQAGHPRDSVTTLRPPPALHLPTNANPVDNGNGSGSTGDDHGQGNGHGNGNGNAGQGNGNVGQGGGNSGQGNGNGQGNAHGEDHGNHGDNGNHGAGNNGDNGNHGAGNNGDNGNHGQGNNGNAYGHANGNNGNNGNHGQGNNGNAYGHANGNGQGQGSGNAGNTTGTNASNGNHGQGDTTHGRPGLPALPGRPTLPGGLGIGRPGNRPGTPGIGDANPHPPTPGNGNAGTPAAGNGNSSSHGNGAANGNGSSSAGGNANGTAASHGNGSSNGSAKPPASGDTGKKAPPKGRGLLRFLPDTLKKKP